MLDENEQGQEPGADDTSREQVSDAVPAVDATVIASRLDAIERGWQVLQGHLTQQAQREAKQRMAHIRDRIREAATQADAEKAVAELDAFTKEMEETRVQPSQQPAEDPSFTAFKRDNPWYEGDDPDHSAMTADADQIGQVAYHRKGLRGAALYAHVAKAIKGKYAHKFTNPRRQAPGAVEAGQGAARDAGPKKKGFAELPEDGKRAFQREVRAGRFKDTPEEREAYAASAYAAMPQEVRSAA